MYTYCTERESNLIQLKTEAPPTIKVAGQHKTCLHVHVHVHTLYTVYMFKNVRFISCAGHQLYERGVDLEVEGVRYIEMHRGPAAYVLGPPP